MPTKRPRSRSLGLYMNRFPQDEYSPGRPPVLSPPPVIAKRMANTRKTPEGQGSINASSTVARAAQTRNPSSTVQPRHAAKPTSAQVSKKAKTTAEQPKVTTGVGRRLRSGSRRDSGLDGLKQAEAPLNASGKDASESDMPTKRLRSSMKGTVPRQPGAEQPSPVRRATRSMRNTATEPLDGLPSAPSAAPKTKRKHAAQVKQERTPKVEESDPAMRKTAISRSRRPRAADFYDLPETPGVGEAGSASSGSDKPSASDLSPTTPRIPWDLYGIADTTAAATAASLPTSKGTETNRVTEKKKQKKTPTTSQQKDTRTLQSLPDTTGPDARPSTSSGPRTEDLSRSRAPDSHDKERNEEYIPVGPGPLPRIPKLPKPSRKPLRKQRPPPLLPTTTTTAVEIALSNTPILENSNIVPPLLRDIHPPTPPHIDLSPEAPPTIWHLGPNPSPTSTLRRLPPPQPGSVFCEPCLREELARWTRVRDAVICAIEVLGGDVALHELCRLRREVQEAEEEVSGRALEMEEGRMGGNGRWRSPPPPPPEREDLEEGGEEEGNREVKKGDGERGEKAGKSKRKKDEKGKRRRRRKDRVVAKPMIVVPDRGEAWEAPHFGEYPPDILGLVLLRMLVERYRHKLARPQLQAMDGLLDELRQELGIGPRFLDALTKLCTSTVVRWRTAKLEDGPSGQSNSQGGGDEWRWEFDDALQTASRNLSATAHSPSSFADTLSKKADSAALAALAALSAQEAATARPIENITALIDSTENIDRLKQALGATIPTNLLLKSIGEQLAQARENLQSNSLDPQTGSKRPAENDPSPSPKRRRKSNTQNITPAPSTPPKLFQLDKEPQDSASPLPCINCSESAASQAHALRQPYSYPFNNNSHAPKPWLKPLMWTFGYSPEEAASVRDLQGWLDIVSSSRKVETVADDAHAAATGQGQAVAEVSAEPVVKFMVDVTGGKTRAVLVESKGVFEVLFQEFCGIVRDGGGNKVRFVPPPVMISESSGRVLGAAARPVGKWENWRGGRLEGFRVI